MLLLLLKRFVFIYDHIYKHIFYQILLINQKTQESNKNGLYINTNTSPHSNSDSNYFSLKSNSNSVPASPYEVIGDTKRVYVPDGDNNNNNNNNTKRTRFLEYTRLMELTEEQLQVISYS